MIQAMENAVLPQVDAERLADFAHRWRVRELAVFGSAARGDSHADSDVDLMVEFLPGNTWDLIDLADMRLQLEAIVGGRVDLIEKGAVKNPHRLASIERDLITVYAA